MKLFPPQDELTIYEQGFETADLLGRQEAGQRLSELLGKVEDPVVVALDGPWGSGKSHFLKRWVGAHRLENSGLATTIYFDAFANDFLDDPLIGLTGAIGERLPAGKKQDHWKTAKTVAYKLARPVLRLGAAAATAGATELAGPVLDAVIEAGGKEAEKAADAFWRREEGRKAAMLKFRECLGQLTEAGAPLIVVIDELDRCRPDYALSMLEVIKHFFAVPKVHFVLGVNLDALEHIVRARYGIGVNAADYLKRFISLSMRLPDFTDKTNQVRAQIKYFQKIATDMGIDQKLAGEMTRHLELAIGPAGVSLRDIEKILTRLVLLPNSRKISGYHHGWMTLIVSLVMLQVIRPDLFTAASRDKLKITDIDGFYGISQAMVDREAQKSGVYNHEAFMIRGLWLFVISRGAEPTQENEHFSRSFDSFGMRDVGDILPRIRRDFFGLFQIND